VGSNPIRERLATTRRRVLPVQGNRIRKRRQHVPKPCDSVSKRRYRCGPRVYESGDSISGVTMASTRDTAGT